MTSGEIAALLRPLTFGTVTAPNRVMFGPHVTNLGDDDRRFTDRHRAFYERRARGGCGLIVTEGASVDSSDWPYERAPLADVCGDGWRSIVDACRPHGALVVASLDHAGGQGSSAYHQRELWAPSTVPEVNTREVPKQMERADIDTVVDGFAAAARRAIDAGCHGVEINAGQHSLVRQFLSGLTNHRDDEWGGDRLRFASDVVLATRAAAGDRIVGLRLSCDELAPWAGITPDRAPELAAQLVARGVDYVVVVRGSIFSVQATRNDFHEPQGYNADLAAAVAAAVGVPVYVQGGIVDVGLAVSLLDTRAEGNTVAGVEMTRAQLADPDLVAKLREGRPAEIRPCILCNQTCQVRDNRNPIVSCVGEPTTGRETEDPDWEAPATAPQRVAVVGGGPAGLEAARVAAIRGHDVTLSERRGRLGGMAAVAGPGAALIDWLAREVDRLGVEVRLGEDVEHAPEGVHTVDCTGSQPGVPSLVVAPGATVLDVADVYAGAAPLPPEGDVVVLDPIGGPIGVAFAESLGERAVLVTQDHIAGNQLSLTGDLAPANVRLALAGVRIHRRAIPRGVGPESVTVSDRFSGEEIEVPCVAVVDCGYRLPSPPLPGAVHRAGDCVAPRTLYEAILEGRRAALAL
ncbi:MAG: mycofactocin system FadH/OYE family oxidoreductase 1 [Acidimicrobiia bacterium]|nr:mycofactocin system FadH/OYE family oxidoreductase 1 [Acidimicrobiia bacterium]